LKDRNLTDKDNFLDFLRDNYKKIIIIGNGGAGAMGMIQHFANSSEQFFKDNILIWHFGNSNENMLLSHFLHIGITYEPNIEKMYLNREIKHYNANKDEVYNAYTTIFIDKLAIYIPKRDKLGFRKTFKNKNTMFKDRCWNSYERIFFFLFDKAIKEFLDNKTEKSILQKYKEAYVSRYDHSAIGEHDIIIIKTNIHGLFCTMDADSKTRKNNRGGSITNKPAATKTQTNKVVTNTGDARSNQTVIHTPSIGGDEGEVINDTPVKYERTLADWEKNLTDREKNLAKIIKITKTTIDKHKTEIIKLEKLLEEQEKHINEKTKQHFLKRLL
jgi:hypothetical protein